MATLSSIRKQISALEKKAQELVKKESVQAIAKARELIERYGLTAESLGLAGNGKKASKTAGTRATRGPAKKAAKASKAAKVGVPMYRDPETGKTWTGRGKPPAWIAGAQDRSLFLIAPSAASATEESQPAMKKSRSTKKAGRGGKRTSAKAAAGQRVEAPAKTGRKATRKAASSRRGPAPVKAAGRKAASKSATKAAGKSKPASAPVQPEGGSDAS